ncbi:MAG: PulJ/GspJ family protein [Bacteriovorax sp.]
MGNSKLTPLLKNQTGFTLIEVLIAIILLSFISLYTFKMVDNSTDTKERVLKEDQLLLQTLTAVSRIDSDFSQLYSPLFSSAKGNPSLDANAVYQDTASSKGAFDGKAKNGMIIPQFTSEDKSTLVFLTASNRRKVADAKESRFSWVRYSVRRSEKTEQEADEKTQTKGENELVRQTISTNVYNSELNWSDVKSQILLTNVKSVEFSFWDEKSKKFLTSLQDLNENKNIVRSLKMELVWVDENNNEQKIIKVYRVLYPYFNSKIDDTATSGAYGDSAPPPGVPNPDDGLGGQGNGTQGGTGVHY